MKSANIGLRVRTFLLMVSVLVLSSCGGGGGASGETILAETAVSGELKPGVVVMSQSELASANSVTVQDGGGMTLSVTSSRLSKLKVDDILHVPANEQSKLSIGFTGKILSMQTAEGLTAIRLAPAFVEDVYKSLVWDIDTNKTGARVAGVITPPGGKTTFKFYQAVNHQTGALIFDENKLSGTVEYERDFKLKNGKIIKLVGEIKLDNIVVTSKGSFDPEKFSTGWGEIGAVVSGKLSGKVGFKAGEKIETSSVGNLLVESGAWKELKWTGSDIFSLEGLGDKDKIGRIPLGGVVITPIITHPFKGGLTQPELQVFSASSAVVVWVYMNADGSLSFEGETGIRHAGLDFKQGLEAKLAGATSHQITRHDKASSSGVDLYAEGSIEGSYRGGLSLAVDILVGGIRPLNVSVFSGAEVTSKLKGKGEIQLYPNSGQLKGHLCYQTSLWTGVEPEFSFRVKANLGGDWIPVGLNANATYEYQKRDRFGWAAKDMPKGCYANGEFSLAASRQNDTDGQVNVNFSQMFANPSVQDLTNVWKVTAVSSNGNQTTFDIPASKAGIDSINLAPGYGYSLKVEAINKEFDLVVKNAATSIMLCTPTQVLNNGQCDAPAPATPPPPVSTPAPAPTPTPVPPAGPGLLPTPTGGWVYTLYDAPIFPTYTHQGYSTGEAVVAAYLEPFSEQARRWLAAGKEHQKQTMHAPYKIASEIQCDGPKPGTEKFNNFVYAKGLMLCYYSTTWYKFDVQTDSVIQIYENYSGDGSRRPSLIVFFR